jgi:glycosyltransferase involved in cell wall biosynthesis
MRFHVVSLPHTHTTAEFSSCAYTQKVRRFCRMMKGYNDNEVILYSGEENDALCDEHVVCINEIMRVEMLEGAHYTEVDWRHPYWRNFNANVIAELQPRLRTGDFICVIGGRAHKAIGDAFPDHATVEFGVGYSGVFSRYRVFESYAWMHMVYGRDGQPGRDLNAVEGKWLDAVIPNQIEPELFDLGTGDRAYFLYVGRLVDLKGYKIAQAVAETLKVPLLLAGPGKHEGYGEHWGEVGPTVRASLMGGAKALFAPTQYIEPFGTVAIEAMACGTPVITTDWGAFTETVIDGLTGFRCRTFAEFCAAAANAEKLDPSMIREYAIDRFGIDTVAKQYRDYFVRLQTVLEKGWYAL